MKKYNSLIISVSIILVEFVVFLVWGLNLGAGDEMGFALITTYLLFPLTALIFSALLAYKNPVSLIPFTLVMFGAQIFLPFIVFGSFEVVLILCFTFIPTAVGAIGGILVKRLRKNNQEKE